MFKSLHNEEAVLKDSARAEMAKKVLETAMHVLDSKMDSDLLSPSALERHLEKKREEEKRKSLIRKSVFGVLGIAAGAFFTAAVAGEFMKAKEIKEAIRDEEQKELYRKLSAIKGR